MHRFLVISDSHNVRLPMEELYKQYPVDGIIHLGDHIADARWMRERTNGHPVYMVRGNCDGFDGGMEEQILEVGGVKLLLCHGHRYGVKRGFSSLVAAGAHAGVQAILFGHTHSPYLEKRDGILLMNPGALSSPFRYFGILEIEEQTVKGALLQQYE